MTSSSEKQLFILSLLFCLRKKNSLTSLEANLFCVNSYNVLVSLVYGCSTESNVIDIGHLW